MEYCQFLFLVEFYLSYFLYANGLKFPLKEIFNISEDVKIAEESYLCSIKSILNRKKCCECTKDCMKYKTCCIDRLWHAEKPVPTQEYLALLINITKQYKDTTCEPVFPVTDKNAQNHESEDALMISTCPKEANHITKQDVKIRLVYHTSQLYLYLEVINISIKIPFVQDAILLNILN